MANPSTPGSGGAVPSTSDFAALLNQKYPGKRINDPAYPGADIGDQWLNYYSAHSGSQSLSALENAFADIILLEDLKGGLTAAGAATGAAQNQAITGAVKGAIEITSWQQGLEAIGKFFASLGKANTWIRISKVLIGGVLLIVGISHMTGTQNAVAAAARKVPLPI
jgi:hypothetical protein